MEQIHMIGAMFASIPFRGATWFTLSTLFFFVWLFAKASRDPKSPVKWEHLIIDSTNDRASPYKVGYLIGLIVGTWVIVRMSDGDRLTYDIFGMYLTYLLGGASVNSYLKGKNDQPSNWQPSPPPNLPISPAPMPTPPCQQQSDPIPRP